MKQLKNIFTLTIAAISMVSFGTLTASTQNVSESIDQAIDNTAEALKDGTIKQEVVEVIDDAAEHADEYKAKAYELKEKLKVKAQKVIDQL